jgi:hypothetical protein
MMKKFDKIGIEELHYLVEFILEKKDNIADLIDAFGVVASNNGIETVFLSPTDPNFKVVWIYQKDARVESVGLGGPSWQLRVSDLLKFYKNFREGFDRYDNEYGYAFYQEVSFTHSVVIHSTNRLFNDSGVLNDINVNGVTIHIKR